MVQKALAIRAPVVENLLLKRQVRDQFARAHVIGSSPAWRRVYQMVQQLLRPRPPCYRPGKAVLGRKSLPDCCIVLVRALSVHLLS